MPDESRCFPAVAEYAARIAATSEELATPTHHAAAEQVSNWISQRLIHGMTAEVIVVCTGNSRRSILGSTMGNIAAATLGLPVKFFSGGTEPSAFNPRTIRALQAIGVQITPTSQNAPSGVKGDPNPVYKVAWGESPQSTATEFSKRYDDPANPQKDFAAIMVCTDAEQNCPMVAGALVRIGMPFDDPKEFDGQPVEAEKYAERRDEIGRVLFRLLKQVERA